MSELSPVTTYLCDAIDSTAENIQSVARQVDSAAELIATSLLEDNKVLICGSGFAAPIAQILTTGLMDQHEFERPGLPAINLSADSVTMSSVAKNQESGFVFSKQVRAIGSEGDCLIAFSLDENATEIIKAIECASEKGMRIILFNGGAALNDLATQHRTQEISFNTQSLSRALELTLLSSNALIRCIESRLFGIPL